MKSKLFLEEGEISRILNMHKKATKNHYLGEQTLGPFNTGNPQLDSAVKNLPNQPKPKTEKYFWNLIQSAGQGNIEDSVVFKSVQVKKKIGDKVRGSFVDNKDDYSSNFVADCSKPNVITMDGSSLQGTTLQVSSNLKDKISKMCGNNTTPEVKVGNETATSDKLQHTLGSTRYLYNSNNKINYVLPKDKTIFKFNPGKNGATFKGYDYDPTTKKAGNEVYNGWFNCSSGKFQVKSYSGTFKYYSDKTFVDFLKAKCGNIKPEKDGWSRDTRGDRGRGSGSGGGSLPFDYDAVIKAINDKCGKDSGSGGSGGSGGSDGTELNIDIDGEKIVPTPKMPTEVFNAL